MPLVKYQCLKGHATRRIAIGEPSETSLCHCGLEAKRTMSNFGIGSKIFFDLMQAESTLLGRNSGEQFRDHRDVKSWEKENGVVQCTAQEQREYREYTTDQVVDQQKIISTEGREAWFDRGDQEEIQQKTGWTDSQYNRWKEVSNEFESRNDDTEAN